MSLVDKFKDWFLVGNNNPETFGDDEDEDNKNVSPKDDNDMKKSYDDNTRDNKTYSSDYENNTNQNSYTPPPSTNNNSRNGSSSVISVNAHLEVVLVKPEVFTDAKQVADHLIKQKTVVLNLENAKPENKRRIIDFLAGVAYAKSGSIKAVANHTYIITPYGVGFVGEDLVGELENNGVIM